MLILDEGDDATALRNEGQGFDLHGGKLASLGVRSDRSREVRRGQGLGVPLELLVVLDDEPPLLQRRERCCLDLDLDLNLLDHFHLVQEPPLRGDEKKRRVLVALVLLFELLQLARVLGTISLKLPDTVPVRSRSVLLVNASISRVQRVRLQRVEPKTLFGSERDEGRNGGEGE